MTRGGKRVWLWGLGVVLTALVIIAGIFIAGRISDALCLRADLAAYPRRYAEQVTAAAARYGVPEDVVYAVMRTESGFDPEAVSHAGAVGLMQLMPETYTWICFLRGEEEDGGALSDVDRNIDAGVFLLSWLYERYRNWETVYAAYNAGYARVNGWLGDPAIANAGVLENIPIYETAQYVSRVSATREKYIALYTQEREATT